MNTFSFLFRICVSCFCLLSGAIQPLKAQLKQDDFQLSGVARFIDANCIQLTPEVGSQGGAIWYQKKINLAYDFEVNAQINLGRLDVNGADGMVFALQPLSNSIGQSGGGMGIMDVNPSLAVEFDTYQNPHDPSFDHIALVKNGNINHTASPGNTLKGPFPLLPNGANAEDGQYRPVKFIWTAATKRFQAFYNNVLLIDHTEDIVNTIFNGDPNVYWGFTAATGGSINDHRVCLESYNVVKGEDCIGANILERDTTICIGQDIVLTTEATRFEPGDCSSFSASLRDKLIACWPFNGNALDQSGNGHNGTVSGAQLTTNRLGEPDKAYQFGGNDVITIPDHPDLRLEKMDFTISAWVDMSAAANFILYKGQGAGLNTPKFIFNYQNGKIGFHVNGPGLGAGIWTYSQTFTASGWTLLSVMRSSNTLIFYANDKQIGQFAFFHDIPSTAGFPLRIGGEEPGGNGGWNGKLDDITIFHRVLSSNELGELMTSRRTFRWSTGETTSSIKVKPAVTTKYYLTVQQGTLECTDSVLVTVASLPTVNIQPSSVTLCSDDPVTLTAESQTPGLTYSWSPSIGLSSVSTASVTARPPSTTQYSVTVTDIYGCTGSDNAQVIVAARPFVQIQPSSTKICLGESVDLQTLASGPGLVYQWSPSSTLSATSGPSVVATPTTTTRYKVSVTTNQGCTTADSVIILVSSVAVPEFQPAVPLVCVGSSITLRIANLGSDVRYEWSPTTGLSAAEGSTIIASPTTTTTYTVTASDAAGCLATGSITVNTAPLPVIAASPTSASICLGSSVALQASSPTSGVNFDWTPTIGLSTPTGPVVTAIPIRNTTYRLTGTDAKGCSSSLDIPVTVLPVPSVNAGPDYQIAVGDRIQLNPIFSADVVNFRWSPASGLSCQTCSKPELRPRSSGVYALEVRNAAGCVASDSLRVELICSDKNLFIPNTFSPNGDGVNDIFYPRGAGMSKVEFLRIFDRWGNMVFEKLNFTIEDKSAGWNGVIKGRFGPPGVYVYTARMICDTNEILNVKGSITLIY